MSHFDPERYSHLDSPIHCWNPRVRLISLSLLIFSVALAGDIIQAAAGLVVSVLLISISGMPLSHVAGFMKWPLIFLLPLFIFLPFTTKGEPFFAIYFISPSIQGLFLGLLFLIRGFGAALIALLIVGTAPFSVTINALRNLGLPGPLTQIFLFAYRYIFLLNEELETMSRSLDSKGFVKRTDLKTARITALAMGMLLIRSYERSENVFHAMLSRGYQGMMPLARIQEIRGIDLFKGFLVAGAALLIHGL
jgi:cobalt/nickel transport system permease protein